MLFRELHHWGTGGGDRILTWGPWSPLAPLGIASA